MSVSMNKVFRLSKCPAEADARTLAILLSSALRDIAASDIRIYSLARSHGSVSSSRTATLMFNKLPSLLRDQPSKSSWDIPLQNLESNGSDCPIENMVLDAHFDGFTPLNNPENEINAVEYDLSFNSLGRLSAGEEISLTVNSCIVISGLASHPFGSWQEKGSDKSYMWIRDAIPARLPNIRIVLYGYDTTLIDSQSGQSIVEISATFQERLLNRYSTASSDITRPLAFLAHSLGGIMLKQTLVLLADSVPDGTRFLDQIRGGSKYSILSKLVSPVPIANETGSYIC